MLIAGSADLLLMFLGLELMVLPGYVMAGYHKSRRLLDRGRDQVLPARLVLERDPAVRARVRVGHDRHDADRRRLRRSSRSIVSGGAPLAPGARPRARVHDHGRRVQDRGGPVPLLDARRVPGLPDAGHRLPVGRAEDRGVRADHPAVRRRARPARGRLERRDHDPRGADDDPRQPRRAGPGQRQADAGVLLDRAHRLHAGRVRRLRRGRAGRDVRACSTTARRTRS